MRASVVAVVVVVVVVVATVIAIAALVTAIAGGRNSLFALAEVAFVCTVANDANDFGEVQRWECKDCPKLQQVEELLKDEQRQQLDEKIKEELAEPLTCSISLDLLGIYFDPQWSEGIRSLHSASRNRRFQRKLEGKSRIPRQKLIVVFAAADVVAFVVLDVGTA